MILQPGMHLGVPHAVYHADPSERPSLSSHMAGILLSKSPAHAHKAHPRLGGHRDNSTADQMKNSVLHDLILGGGAEIVEVDADDFRTKAAQAIRDQAIAEGKTPIIRAKLEALRKQADRVRACLPFTAGVDCTTEATAIWTDENGTPCRCRIDCLQGFTVYDLKFFEGGTPRTVDLAAAQNGYFVQAAANIEAVDTLVEGAMGRTRFVLVFVDPDEPEIGTLYREVRGQALDIGRKRWTRAKSIWAGCLKSDKWPGFSTEVEEVKCPAWMANDEMDAQIASDVKPF